MFYIDEIGLSHLPLANQIRELESLRDTAQKRLNETYHATKDDAIILPMVKAIDIIDVELHRLKAIKQQYDTAGNS